MVGSRSMGALVYEPEGHLEEPTVLSLEKIAQEVALVQKDADARVDLEKLLAIGDSPQGARPRC
jgi:hypothetical protein